jgi:hypothetical protein
MCQPDTKYPKRPNPSQARQIRSRNGNLAFPNPAKRKVGPQFLPHLNAARTFFAVMQPNLYWEYIGRSA